MITENYSYYPMIDGEDDKAQIEKTVINQKIVSIDLSSHQFDSRVSINLENGQTLVFLSSNGDFGVCTDVFCKYELPVIKEYCKCENSGMINDGLGVDINCAYCQKEVEGMRKNFENTSSFKDYVEYEKGVFIKNPVSTK